MKINPIFDDVNEINIESILQKRGVVNPKLYLKANTIEDMTHYDNIDKAKELIIEYDDLVYLLIDCDVDGYMSASIMYLFLKRLNPNINIIPLFHSGKQHGISDKDILKYLKTQPPSLLITPDSSVNDDKECKALQSLGFDILIGGEHHEIEKPNDYATIVSNELGDIENRDGSGGLVTWKMCSYINKDLCKDLISYVMLSLIGDSMSMASYENYTFTYWGKKRIHKYLQPFISELNKDGDTESNKSYSYGCITNINSLIRLGNMEEKEELFRALVGEIEPHNIISRCKYYHTKQSNDSKKLMNDVDIIYDNKAVIAKMSQKTTLTGLVANKLMSEYNKPVLLVHNREDGYCDGSVRSPIPIKDILNESGLFQYNSGHSFAHGTSYHSDNEQAIIDYMDGLVIDCEPCRDVLISSTVKSLPNNLFYLNESYKGIYGMNIPIPQVHIRPFTIYNTDISLLGANKTTLKFSHQGIDFIMFFVSQKVKEKLYLNDDKKQINIECIVELGINEFRGNKKYQAEIKHFEVTEHKQMTFEELFGE